MEEYYKVLQWLRETHIDRQYPYEFDNIDGITINNEKYTNIDGKDELTITITDTNQDPIPNATITIEEKPQRIELVEDYASDFNNSLHIRDLQADDKVRIHLSRIRDYNDIDYFEILFYSEETITPSDIEIGFSNTKSGVANQVELKEEDISAEDCVINEDGYHQFRYLVRKANTKMQKKNRWISSVYCINIKFNKPVSEFYLSNLVARTDQFTLTLEDLDEQIVMGKNYVMNQLRAYSWEDIPPQLEHLCFKSAGAFSWLIWWENEGKVMDDGTKEGRNYATRLLEQIDRFIENYLASNGFGDPNLRLLGWTEFCNVDPNCKTKCKRNRQQWYKGSRLV